MFKKLFKKQEESDYSTSIVMVHDEFNSAGEKLYQDALAIINSIKVLNESKVERLTRLGFTATKEVEDAQRILKNRRINEGMVETISYYRTKYPLNKFITEDQVQSICSKYGLVYGKIDKYTGFVPEKNLSEIEKFVVADDDKKLFSSSGWGERMKAITREEAHIKRMTSEEYIRRLKDARDNEKTSIVSSLYSMAQNSDRIIVDNNLYIAAPQKDFKISDKQEIKKFAIINKPVPDPVVLAPVIGGFLIVTAWGDEASDPIVQNEINN